MKKIFTVKTAPNEIHLALFLIRVAFGGLMLVHGLPKMDMLLSGGPVQFPPVLGLSPVASLSLAVFAEVLCPLFLIAGLGTRLAVVPLIATMLVAVLVIHSADPFARQELAVLYLVPFVALLFSGSGKFSLDYLLQPQAAKKGSPMAKEKAFAI